MACAKFAATNVFPSSGILLVTRTLFNSTSSCNLKEAGTQRSKALGAGLVAVRAEKNVASRSQAAIEGCTLLHEFFEATERVILVLGAKSSSRGKARSSRGTVVRLTSVDTSISPAQSQTKSARIVLALPFSMLRGSGSSIPRETKALRP